MMILVLYIPFNIIQVILRRWNGDNEKLCQTKAHITTSCILPLAGIITGSKGRSANHTATRCFYWDSTKTRNVFVKHYVPNYIVVTPKCQSGKGALIWQKIISYWSSLIWVCTVCTGHFDRKVGAWILRTITIHTDPKKKCKTSVLQRKVRWIPYFSLWQQKINCLFSSTINCICTLYWHTNNSNIPSIIDLHACFTHSLQT